MIVVAQSNWCTMGWRHVMRAYLFTRFGKHAIVFCCLNTDIARVCIHCCLYTFSPYLRSWEKKSAISIIKLKNVIIIYYLGILWSTYILESKLEELWHTEKRHVRKVAHVWIWTPGCPCLDLNSDLAICSSSQTIVQTNIWKS